VPQLLESIDIRKLCNDGAKRVIRVRETLLTCLAERGRKSLRARLEGVWLALGGPAVLSESADIDNAESYFRLLENLDQSGEPEELSRIEEKLKGLYAAPDPKSDSRFQIMTIHKAKGLEFDTVIIPGLGRRPANADKPLLRWMSVVGECKGEEELLMAPLSATGNEKDPFFGLLKNIEDRRDLYETDRLLYVACTRARKKLHLLGHAKASGKDLQPKAAKGSLLHRLWPILEPEFLKLQAKPDSINIWKVEVAHPKLNRLPGRWTLPELPSVKTKSQLADAGEEIDAAIEFDWAKESLRMIGTVVHGELEQVGRQGIGTWSESRVNQNSDYYRTRLLTLGHPDVGLDDAVANVKLSLCNTLEDETGRWILSEKKEARCELAISGVLDGEMISVILDRTFVDADGRRWIIDYKTSRHGGSDLESFLDLQQQRYCHQLERYARLMREIDDRPIRLGLYFPLLKSWREWSPVP
jgi:ATP-dependent exoDNAse (exonuclease V) beta subunit